SFSVNYTITDASGRTATAVVSVTVVDAEPPVLVCPPGVSVSFGQQNNLALTGQATATDACAGVVAPVFTDNNSGVTACTGAIIRSWTATDPGGNTASCQQTIVVADTEPPVFSLCPPAVTVACGQQNDLNLTGQAQATDNCAAPTLAYSDVPPTPAGCSTTILRQWTAADPGGNAAFCEQIITLVDEQAPVITLCPPAVTVACGQHLNLAVTGLPQAADACNGVLPPVFSDNNSGFNGCSGTILRTWTVRDSCANTASCLQTLSVFDNAPPVISCPPPVTVTCGQQTVAAFTGAATASDACTANPVLNFTDDNSQFSGCSGFITRTWRAIDQCGNTSTCTQTVTVLEAPCAFSAAFSTTAASCLGDCTGSAHTQVLPPGAYTYVWENGETGPNPTGLCPGPVSVSITDVQNFCTQIFTIDVPVAPPPTLLLVGAQPPSSPTSNDGRLALQIQAVAPDPPYQVFVNGNSIGFVPGPGFTINNLPAGFYQLWVVDGGGSGCLSNVVEVELFPQEGRPAPGVPELGIWMPQAPGGLLSRALEERLLSQQAPEMPGAAYHWPSAVGIRWSQVLGAGREVYVETARQSGWRRPGAGWASPVIAQQFGFGLRQFVPAGRRLAVFREIGVGAAQLRSETAALHSWQLPVGGGFRWVAQAGWGLELEARCRLEWAPAIKTSAAVFEIRLSAFLHASGRKSAPVLEAAPASYFQTEN
ncbi:MAG: hypothetical protein JNK89_01540, partial [Saprospiraceae bacterium]|nr:hypothetical protein [Saprospiraceae bacterium]